MPSSGEDAGEVIPAGGHGVARAELFAAPVAVGGNRLVESRPRSFGRYFTPLWLFVSVPSPAERVQRLRAGELAQGAHNHFACHPADTAVMLAQGRYGSG